MTRVKKYLPEIIFLVMLALLVTQTHPPHILPTK